MTKIYVAENHFNLIKKILRQHPYKFFAFGSRVTGKHRPLSDLDLLVEDDIDGATLENIRSAFEESDIPFKVDIVLRKDMSPEFYALVEKDLREI